LALPASECFNDEIVENQSKDRAPNVMERCVRSAVVWAPVALLVAGCAKKQASCQNAVDNLIRIEFYGNGRNPSRDERKMIEEMLPGERARLVDWCEKREFSQADLQCVVDARRHAEWLACGEFNAGYGPPLPENLPRP
jgi:hypothetical protein